MTFVMVGVHLALRIELTRRRFSDSFAHFVQQFVLCIQILLVTW